MSRRVAQVRQRLRTTLAAIGPKRLALLSPVLAVVVITGVVMAQSGRSTVRTDDEAMRPSPRMVSTSKGVPGAGASSEKKGRATKASVTKASAAKASAAKAKPTTTAVAKVEPPVHVPVSEESGGTTGPQLLPVLPPEPWPQGCCAPLTNLGFDAPEGEAGPAVAVKVSNAPEADPQTNLHRADLIYELRAEDVSRFIAVYHSRAADVIGPIRSGRTADPLIIKSLGRPMLAFSGGNDYVMAMMEAREVDGTLIRMTNSRAAGGFFRSDDRNLPHNFYGHRPVWIAARGGEALPPKQQTAFLGAGGVSTVTGQPVKVSVDIGQSHSWWQWDDSSQMWLRFQHNRPHIDKDTGYQIGRTSVIILGTDHPPSAADKRSPEAVSTGVGEAWVMTGRDYIHGTWRRSSPDDGWHFFDDQGKPIALQAGPVYIGLTGVRPVIE